uniref:Uncharacterized protein n=1 Tax=Sphaerodactylus townsendi TaxID=933632 RepID=A0ACB8F394_9SAUR
MTGNSYNIYNAMYSIAHALHAMYTFGSRFAMMGKSKKLLDVQPWQIHASLRNTQFNNTAGEEVVFAENDKRSAGYDILNLIFSPNHSSAQVKVGRVDPRAPPGRDFIINSDAIVWTTQVGNILESC